MSSISSISSISYAYFSSICYNDEKNYKHVETVGPAADEREAFKQICEFIASVENDQVFDERFSREVLAIAETGDSAQLEQIVDEHEPIRCQFFVWSTTKLPLMLKSRQLEQEENQIRPGEEEQDTPEEPSSKKRKIEVIDLTQTTSTDSEDDDYDGERFEIDQILSDKIENGRKMYLVSWVGYTSAENQWITADCFEDKNFLDQYEQEQEAKKLATDEPQLK
jgi:hypothetical protein